MRTMQLVSNGRSYSLERVESGLYRVHSADELLGFVERAGSVYVALAGSRYDRAEESGQALSLGSAVSMLPAPEPQTAARAGRRGLVRALRSVA